MIKIPLKPKKRPKYPIKLKENDQNTPKPKNGPKYPRTPKNDQNTLET